MIINEPIKLITLFKIKINMSIQYSNQLKQIITKVYPSLDIPSNDYVI